jgi:hypothetical protein
VTRGRRDRFGREVVGLQLEGAVVEELVGGCGSPEVEDLGHSSREEVVM